MGTNPEAYVDTSALIAFLDRSDTYHLLFCRLFADPPKLITTPLVVAEGHAWFLRRYDRTRALQFLAMIESMRPLKLVGIGPREQKASTDILRKFSDQDLTLVDAAGLHLMSNLGIQNCWSTDFHLGLTGIPLIIHKL
ncbi:type II toxin-antitoxin system VapC family toxin [Candidatus Nitrospira salsa]